MADNENAIPGVAEADSRVTRASVSVARSVLPAEHRAHQQKLAQSGYGIPDGFYALHPDTPKDEDSAEEKAGDGGQKAGEVDQISPHDEGVPEVLPGTTLRELQRSADLREAARTGTETTRTTATGVIVEKTNQPNADATKTDADAAASGNGITQDGLSFASDEAAELYVSEGLAPSDFSGKTPSGKGGFTKADVEAAAKAKGQ